jgi:hypothetical protein
MAIGGAIQRNEREKRRIGMAVILAGGLTDRA